MNATAGNWFVAKAFGNPDPRPVRGAGRKSFALPTSRSRRTAAVPSTSARPTAPLTTATAGTPTRGSWARRWSSAKSGGIPSNVGFATCADPGTRTLIDGLAISIDPTGQPTSTNVEQYRPHAPCHRRAPRRWTHGWHRRRAPRLGIGCGVAGGPPDQIGDEDARSTG